MMRRRGSPRANFIVSDQLDELVHVPDLRVSDHEGTFRVGFLSDRFPAERAESRELLPSPNADWAAPRKLERRR